MPETADTPPPAPGPAGPPRVPGRAPASGAPAANPPGRPRPLGGVAAGLALVLLAVIVGMIGQHASEPATTPAASGVTPTGRTTTVSVSAKDMRFHPDQVSVARGDRLVVNFTNADDRRHDLVLDNGAHTPLVAPGGTARLDAGVIGRRVSGWCSLPGHRQAGMVFTVTVTGQSGGTGTDGSMAGMSMGSGSGADAKIDFMVQPGAGFAARDATLPPVEPGRLHRVTLHVQEVEREVAPGVRQKVWTFGGTVPGPVLHGRVGDTFEVTLVNDGSMEHGIDFHAGSLAPQGPMRQIAPGQSLVYRFTAGRAGVWMYHCSSMPMLYHIGNGMYGAVVIDPPGLAPVDREYLLVQSELYLGPAGQTGDAAKMRADQPDAVVFNGYANQYMYRPLQARAGQRVRIWVLDAGPNRSSSFHVVGAQFDTVYQEGAWRLRPDGTDGGSQVLALAPAEGGFVETVFPEAGTYPFLSHVVVDADRGARGAFSVTG